MVTQVVSHDAGTKVVKLVYDGREWQIVCYVHSRTAVLGEWEPGFWYARHLPWRSHAEVMANPEAVILEASL